MIVNVAIRLRVQMRAWNAWCGAPGWSNRRRVRPWPEGLEGRALLASITDYPIPTPVEITVYSARGQITSGPDGNLWFTNVSVRAIHRVDLTGKMADFLLPGRATPWGIEEVRSSGYPLLRI
jgi:hypothetical protein